MKRILYLIGGLLLISLFVYGTTTVSNLIIETPEIRIFSPNTSADLTLRPGTSITDARIVFRNATPSEVHWFISYNQDTAHDELQFTDVRNGTTVLTLDRYNHSAFFIGDVSALSFTDRTYAPKDSVDVLNELKNIKVTTDCVNNKCQIDKSTLPIEMIKTYIHPDTEEILLGRDLTYTVSHLIRQNQLLLERIEQLEYDVDQLQVEKEIIP